jgi:hypothetical protein
MEQEKPQGAITDHFPGLDDPRLYNRRRKPLDIVVRANRSNSRSEDTPACYVGHTVLWAATYSASLSTRTESTSSVLHQHGAPSAAG